MPGINTILDIGRQALFGNQAAIQTTGNNIANVNTPGYSRQTVRFEERFSIDYRPGQIGTGVEAVEVLRHFDEFVENQYLDQNTLQERYGKLWDSLKSVESLFNEAHTEGVNAALAQFYQDWQDLSLRPDDIATRDAMVGHTLNLINIINNTSADMERLQQQMDDFVRQETAEVNRIVEQIAEINSQINVHHVENINNANSLFDERASLIRELAEKVDIKTIDNGGGDLAILTQAGHTLVDGVEHFELRFEPGGVSQKLASGSAFDGSISFEGVDDFEYYFEVVQAGDVTSGAGAAQLRVSLDGGRTFLKNDDGTELRINARPEDYQVDAGNLSVWFDGATQPLSVGDTFTVVPKNALHWYENTSSYMDITPQKAFDGADNERRLTGGEIAGYLEFRDDHVGRYKDRLDALAEALIWEVNRLHSQGAGLSMQADVTGDYTVRDPNISLGSGASGLAFGDKLQQGNMTFYVYDSSTGELASGGSFGPLDFGPATAGIQNFDPDQHSLQEVADAFNRSYANITASVQNNQLRITADSGYEFGFGADSTGLMAALGVNTFFKGEDAGTLALKSDVRTDLNRICAGSINGDAEANEGDNTNALRIAGLEHKDVSISTTFEVASNQTISEFYNTIVATVGTDTANARFSYSYHETLAKDLNDRQESVAGVNLDEEMSNLIKFQHSYTAAAKLITTADQMLQTILGMKS